VRWDLYNVKDMEEDVRKEFKGEMRINPITGRVEPMFGETERLLRYIKSFFICLPAFIVVFFVIVCFLNLTGIVNALIHGGLFHIESLS
jgi:hypothetical protein